MHLSEAKKQLKLHEPENALAPIEALETQCRVDNNIDVLAMGTSAARLHLTDNVLFHFGVECLEKV